MLVKKLTIIICGLGVLTILIGAGCKISDQPFPPKPPVPGVDRSPALERLSPGSE